MYSLKSDESVTRPKAIVSLDRVIGVVSLGLIGLGACAAWALLVGYPTLSPGQLLTVIGGGGDRLARIVVLELRLPRLILGLLAGAMLADCGVLLQGCLGNALAGPELLGISTGASLVIAAIVVLDLKIAAGWYPWLGLLGALVAGLTVLGVSYRSRDNLEVLLVGVALTALGVAATTALVSLGRQSQIQLYYQYSLGSLNGRGWDYVGLVTPWAGLGVVGLLFCVGPLNVLRLGEEMAEGLGLHIVRTRLGLMLLSIGLVAPVVAACGPIAFVALLAPHLARRLLATTDARFVLPVTALLGSLLLVGADCLAKNVFAPTELPVGIWTSLLAGPLLIGLLRHNPGKK